MALIDDHMKDCERFLGDDMYSVHAFLDQYSHHFPVAHFDDYHRTFLHNSYGLRIMRARYGYKGWAAVMLHLTRDYVEGSIDHWTFTQMAKEFPRRLMWFNKMVHTYEPRPHTIRAWGGKSLVSLAMGDEK